jgi:hypothetical protein
MDPRPNLSSTAHPNRREADRDQLLLLVGRNPSVGHWTKWPMGSSGHRREADRSCEVRIVMQLFEDYDFDEIGKTENGAKLRFGLPEHLLAGTHVRGRRRTACTSRCFV